MLAVDSDQDGRKDRVVCPGCNYALELGGFPTVVGQSVGARSDIAAPRSGTSSNRCGESDR